MSKMHIDNMAIHVKIKYNYGCKGKIPKKRMEHCPEGKVGTDTR